MEQYYLAAICMAEQIGCTRAKHLLNHFGSAKNVWQLPREELLDVKLPISVIDSLVNLRRSNPDCPEKIFEYCSSKNIQICGIKDDNYPELLRAIPDSPALFYYKGQLKPEAPRVAIVGTRQATRYGEAVARKLAEEIARAGVTVVSGAAFGIDTFAHYGALRGGRTIAVLGGGLESNYNFDKMRLLGKILENDGVIISEYAPMTRPSAGTFPQRNRIIAGLSIGVVVVEAGEKSGALNTVQHAGEYGRLVFAVPNNIYAEKSRGCHVLLRDGAILTRSADDILEDCRLKNKNDNIKNVMIGLTPLENKEEAVCKIIPMDIPISADEILMKLDDIESAEIMSILLNLEVNGYIRSDSSGKYIRIYGNY